MITSSDPTKKGVVPKVTHAPTLLVVDVGVVGDGGSSNPIEYGGRRPCGTNKGDPCESGMVLTISNHLVETMAHLAHQLIQGLQHLITINILSSPQTSDVSFVAHPFQTMENSSPKGMLMANSHIGIKGIPVIVLL